MKDQDGDGDEIIIAAKGAMKTMEEVFRAYSNGLEFYASEEIDSICLL